jgi:uncharacterized protein YcbK (DUF882 family)
MYKLALAILLAAAAQTVALAGRRVAPTPNARSHKTVSEERKTVSEPRKTADDARKPDAKRAATTESAPPLSASPKGRAARASGRRASDIVTFQSGDYLSVVKGRVRPGQKDYDPNQSRNPLLDTSGENRQKMLSDDFSVDEFAKSGNKRFGSARIDPRQVMCLQKIRDYVGKAVWISSGYRSYEYNEQLYKQRGKEPTRSQHISGRASDITIEGMTGLKIAKAAIDACGPDIAVGLGAGYAHIDVRGYPAAWEYDGVSPRQTAELERYRASKRLAQRERPRRQRRGQLPKRA